MELPCVHGSLRHHLHLAGRPGLHLGPREEAGVWERREGDSSEMHGGQGLSHGGAAVRTSRAGADRKHMAGRA